MKLQKYIAILIIVLSFGYNSLAQDASCKGFAKSGLAVLDTSVFVHDGRYNTVRLSEGDKIDIYKPFYKGRKYKIVAMAEAELPGLNITIKDVKRQELYKSDETLGTQEWEYVPTRTENLIISVEIPKITTEDGEKLKRACVAIIIGFSTS